MCDCNCCCGNDEVGEGGGAGIFKIVLACIALAIVVFFLWTVYLGAVAALNAINNLLYWIADQIIFTSPLLALIAVVYAISIWARRNAPQIGTAKTLAIRDQRSAPARKANVIHLPYLRSVPVQRAEKVRQHSQ